MPSTKDKVQNHGLFALFKGAPNTAKSGAAYSFPNPFVLDFDRKMPTVALKHFPNKEFNWECFEDVFAISDYLKPWLIPPDKPGHVDCPYETLITDTVTSLSTTVLRSVDKTKGTDIIKQMGNLVGSGANKTVEVMSYDYYNAEANFFEKYFMDNMKILWARPGNPKHVIIIAHEITVESAPNISTGLIKTTKSIVTAGRKVAAFIPSRFDEEYVFKIETPAFGDTISKNKRLCITSEKEDARSAYNFPTSIDFTGKSLYDELNKVAQWS